MPRLSVLQRADWAQRVVLAGADGVGLQPASLGSEAPEQPLHSAHTAQGELMRAMNRGDSDAFALFYDRWHGFILAETRRLTGCDEHFCMDILQACMMRIIRSTHVIIDDEPALRAWLRLLVRSACYDRFRRELRHRRHSRDEVVADSRTSEASADDGDLHEMAEWIRQELESLNASHGQMLALRYRFGWTLERIAGFLGVKPGAVDGRIRRILARLRERAGERFDE